MQSQWSNNNNGDDDTCQLTGTPADEPTGPTVITSPRISRTPMTTVTCASSTHSIPINVILPSLSLLDAHNSVGSLSPTTRFFQQPWLSPATEQGSMDIQQQQQQQQQPAFLSPQPFCSSYYGSLGSTSYKSPSCASSYFDFSHVDVVMDDGSRQKRTVSLSTVPRFPSIPSLLSPRAGVNETTKLLASPTSYDDRQHQQQHQLYYITTAQQQLTKSKIRGLVGEDSDDDDEGSGRLDSIQSNPMYTWLRSLFTLTTKQQQVLKCSLAYVLGSLFTFVPVLHDWINNGDSSGRNQVASHMAATVTVFFNPAKSVGGMIEAAGLGWIMTLAALSVCLASLWTTEYLMDTQHQFYLSYGITLFGWLLASTLFLAFLKAQYARRPSVGTASSLAFILLFPILVREHTLEGSEYGRQKIQDNFAIVAIGTAISAVVCVLIWPQTATKKFNSNMIDSLSSLRVLLKLLTKTFLLDTDLPDFKANEPLTKAIKTHNASFTALQSSLREARLEWWWWLRWDDNDEDGHECMVKSMQRLTLHIGGLRKSCGLQFDRIQQTTTATAEENDPAASAEENDPHVTYNIKADNHRRTFERTLKRERSMTPSDIMTMNTTFNDNISNSTMATAKQPNHDNNSNDDDDGLVVFLRTVGPPMKSLAFTCKQTILHLQNHISPRSSNTSSPSFATLRRNLELALETFEQSQQKALLRLYRRHRRRSSTNANKTTAKTTTATATTSSTTRRPSTLDPTPSAVQTQLLAHLPADDLFLVYFFVFCLIAFAKELRTLMTCMEQSFEQRKKAMSLTSLVFRSIMLFQWFVTAAFRSSSSSSSSSLRPHSNNKYAVDTLHTPTPRYFIHYLRMHLWEFFSWFRKHQVRYAIKAGLTALLLASFAFLPSTRDYFQTYRMEWTLITTMAVMTPTVGGTNFNAVLRVGATIIGVATGGLIYHLFSGFHVIWLVMLTWLISIPCFWLILYEPKYGKFGQFTLLAYNLVILYEYNHPELNVFDLAYQRFVAVSLGVVIGLMVTTYIWPYAARKSVRFGLSDLLLGFSWQYSQMNNSNGINDHGDENNDEVTLTIPKQQQPEKEDTALLDLQQQLHHLSALLNHTPNEPRLKGRFPFETYQVMLRTCQSILDNLVMMQMVTHQPIMMIKDSNAQWTDMVGNVVLYFYVLASALQLKTPLPLIFLLQIWLENNCWTAYNAPPRPPRPPHLMLLKRRYHICMTMHPPPQLRTWLIMRMSF
ncbi:Fusaric acid resistance protein-like-domain-containing protein [Absidia repens]|uniref:Fusaric acid resistance protein-like-domain-containing protein n=1 Tax=Absidia repens TaxID=90262 RepID=A0A1X2IK50_9FUNG|nr:Fusaric acid resistance protein-like-domain-containing protein [Absidia repens]